MLVDSVGGAEEDTTTFIVIACVIIKETLLTLINHVDIW
jgi:hypothetical protein